MLLLAGNNMNTMDFQMIMGPSFFAMNDGVPSKVHNMPQQMININRNIGSTNDDVMSRNSDSSSGVEDMNNMFTKFAFPFKLHSILENSGTAGQDAIISWLPSGKAFKIHKPKEFADVIMPRYFNQTKYRSFQRQLYIYGFDRIKDKSSDDYGAYHHDLFIRGVSDLCLDMTRKKIKGTGLSNEERKRKASIVRSKSKPSSRKRPSKTKAVTSQSTTITNQASLFFAKENSQTTQSMHEPLYLSSQSAQVQQTTRLESSEWNNANTATVINSALQAQKIASGQGSVNNNNAGLLPQCDKFVNTGRRCSLGFVRGTHMGRRGSLLCDGDEVGFGDRKFYLTTDY